MRTRYKSVINQAAVQEGVSISKHSTRYPGFHQNGSWISDTTYDAGRPAGVRNETIIDDPKNRGAEKPVYHWSSWTDWNNSLPDERPYEVLPLASPGVYYYAFPNHSGNIGNATLARLGTWLNESTYGIMPIIECRPLFDGRPDEIAVNRYSEWSAEYPKSDQVLTNSCLDEFYHDNSAVEGLLNLIESPEIPEGLVSFYDRVKRFRNSPSLKKRFIRAGSLASSAYLFYRFAIAPLLQESDALEKAILTHHSRIKRYMAQLNKVQRYTSFCNGQLTNTREAWLQSHMTSRDDILEQKPMISTCQRRVVLKGKTSFPRFTSDWVAKSNYLTSTFAASGPATLGWELVPFSFVIDWFVDLRGILGYWDNLLTGSQKTIVSATVSEKRLYRANMIYHEGSRSTNPRGSVQSPADNCVIATVSNKYYSREPFVPQHKVAMNVRFGKNQLAITAALVYELVANLKSIRLWRRG